MIPYVEALGQLGKLPYIMDNLFKTNNMEDRKTITLPYDEYLELVTKASQNKITEDDIRRKLINEEERYEKKYSDCLAELSKLKLRLAIVQTECENLKGKNTTLVKLINSLRWWHFWFWFSKKRKFE